MDRVKMPEFVSGEWIWKKSLLNKSESFLFARKEFILDYSGVEGELWISAHCIYQLFINERFVGYGPRYNNDANYSYVDQYNVSYYLQPGNNVIAVVAHYTGPRHFDHAGESSFPGIWCQLDVDNKTLLCSDPTWDVTDGDCFDFPRPQESFEGGKIECVDFAAYPSGWDAADFKLPTKWDKACVVESIEHYGGKLEICPLAPNALEEPRNFQFIERGICECDCASSHVAFDDIIQGEEGVYAATTFFFSEEDNLIQVVIHADDPYKFFCNNRLVNSNLASDADKNNLPGMRSSSVTSHLHIKSGWNRLLVIQRFRKNSMGFVLLFPEHKQQDIRFFQDTIQDAPSCWNIAGPLKLPLQQATPSLQFERLYSKPYRPTIEQIPAGTVLLANATLQKNTETVDTTLKAGEYLVYKLDCLRYGFVRIEIEASTDDIIHFTTGYVRQKNGIPAGQEGQRTTHTIRCRKGINRYLKFKPCECCYLLINAVISDENIKVNQVTFDETVRAQRNETLFRCSDEDLNVIWETGKRSLRRSTACSFHHGQIPADSCYMTDAYIHACNMITVFGDYYLSETRLRQFAAVQFENGDIPALTFGKQLRLQLDHLFFFPVWLNYHYKASGNESLLHEMLPHLDLLFDFFQSLLDDEAGLLLDIDQKFNIGESLNRNVENRRGAITDINSMYCRFLLSSAETYRSANRPETLTKCFRLASEVAKNLKRNNWLAEAHLFAQGSVDGVPHGGPDAFTNFAALYSGVAPPQEFENIFYKFFDAETPFAKFPEQTSGGYFNYLFLETLFAMDQAEWGINYLKEYWLQRINLDVMAWKTVPDAVEIASTRFHGGNTIVPNVFIIREVAGVRVAEPGYSTIYFNPNVEILSWAEVVIPTNYGKIRVKWKTMDDGTLDVIIDAKFPLKVLPEMSVKQISTTTFRLGENVVLLDPDSEN